MFSGASFKLRDPSPRSYPSLINFPLEVGEIIWSHLLVLNEDEIEICPPRSRDDSAESEQFRQMHVIAVLRVSKIIYQETMPTFYRCNTHFFEYSHYLEHFLKRCNPKSRQLIGSIHLEFVGSNPAQAFKALLLCEQLRHLQLDTCGGILDGK